MYGSGDFTTSQLTAAHQRFDWLRIGTSNHKIAILEWDAGQVRTNALFKQLST